MSSERTESLASPPSSQTSATTTTTAALAPATQTPIQAADATELATCGGEQQTIGKFVTGADCKLPLESNSNLNINQNHHTPESTHSQQQHHQQTTNQNQNSNPNSNNNNNNSNHHNKQTSKSMDSQQMHVCRLCDKLLSSSSSLDRHMLTHSGERPFVCKRCHMTFTTNGNMHRHMRTHLHKDSLARQQQEQQLKSLAIGQTSHSTSSPPPVAPSTLTNNNLDNTLAKHQVPGGFSNPLVPQGSAEAAAAATTRPFGHRNSHLEETRTHSPQEPFSSNQFGATFKHQQQQQPIRTRRAHHQLQQQQQQQQQQLHHQSGAQEFFSTANQIAGNDNLLALSSQLGPHRHQHHLFNGNAGLTDLAQHSGAGSPAPIRLHSPAMAPESQSAAAAKFLRHQASLDPKALMMGALAAQGDQLGLESVKAVMLAAAAAAAAAAAVSQQQQQHSAGAKRSHPVDADHESNQDGDELARLSSASANGNEDDSDDRAAERPARFARGKRRKQVNPRSTRMAAAVQQAAAASTAGMSDSDGDQDEAEQARSVSSLSCDIRPARDLHSVYEANLRLKGGEPYQDDDEPLEEEFDDEDEDRELFESKLARRAHGRGASSLAGSTSENQMAGSEEDGDADYSDQEQDINLSGLETTMIKREQQEQDFNNNQDNDTNCRDVEAEEDDDGDGNESGPDDMSMLEGEHNGDNKRHEPTQFSIMQSDDDGEVDRDDDEDDDEASGSSCNVNMNLSDNTSNSANDDHDRRAQQQMQMHQHQQQQQMLAGGLPVPQLTTMNGEVIEDISQSYVKTANPNAARKGGKRNRHCYKCKLCTYSSVDRCTLVRHLRIHSGERPYICGICRYAFTTKANCERHVRKRHKKQYNSLGGAGGGGVKGSNGGGRSLIITDHTNHQTIPVKVNPVAAQTISQTLQRIQEKQLQHNSNSQADDEMDNIERIQSNQQHHQQQHHNNNHHNHHHHHHQQQQQQQQQHSQPTRQQSHQQPSDHVNTRSNNETTTSLTTSGYKQNKRKHRNDETLADDSNHSAPYQRRRLTDKHADDLFSSTRLANGNILYNQPQQQQPNSFIAGQVAAAAAAAAAAGTGAEIPSTNELFANLMAQLQQVTNQHQDSTANGGAGETIRMAQTPTSNSATFLANMLAAGKTIGADGQRSLLIPKQLSQQFPQLHNLNSQTPFFIRRNPFDPFNPIDLAAQALDLSCKFQSK